MANSQQEAVAAAFEELDIAYQVTVNGVIEGTPADGVLEVGDQLISANGVAIEGITELRAAIAENGSDRAMAITVDRGGVEQTALGDAGSGVGQRPDADHRHPGRLCLPVRGHDPARERRRVRAPEPCSRSVSTTS